MITSRLRRLRGAMRRSIRTRLLVMGALGSAVPVLAMVVLTAGMQRRMDSQLGQLLDDETDERLTGVAQSVALQLQTQYESLDQSLEVNIKVLRDVAAGLGRPTADGPRVSWQAKNQLTGKVTPVTLPGFRVGGTWLGQNSDPRVRTPIVDAAVALTGGTVTVFQRMNDEGDMLRVATTVISKEGKRAIGTYIPAVTANGAPNPVITAVIAGQAFRGRAFVVDAWYQTIYEPITDASGHVIGMYYAGLRQESVPTLRKGITETRVGHSGHVTVLGGTGDQRGRWIISRENTDGASAWDVTDQSGDHWVRSLIAAAVDSTPGKVVVRRHLSRDEGEREATGKIVAAIYFKPWDWVVTVTGIEAEFEEAQVAMSRLVMTLLVVLVIAGLVVAAVALYLTSRTALGVTSRVVRLAEAADRVAAGEVDHAVVSDGEDEIEWLGRSMARVIEAQQSLAESATRLADGDLAAEIALRSPKDVLGQSFIRMRDTLRELDREMEMLRDAGLEGHLDVRGDASKFHGAYSTLVEGMNATLEASIAPIAEAAAVLERVADSDLTAEVHADYRGDHAKIKDALNGAVAEMRSTVSTIARDAERLASRSADMSEVSAQMGAAAEATSARAGDVSAASEQVSKNVQTVAAATEEMGASIREISMNASEAAKVAARGVEVARSTTDTVAKLGSSSAEIGAVIKVITSIAEQTNLLALNATIEAARAGEAGKGFAVVANEVKELAKETAKATEDIGRRIEAIQRDTTAAVAAIGEITDIVASINDLQGTIASAVEEQTAMTSEIARNVTEAATGSLEIARSITGVAAAAEETNAGVVRGQGAAGELAQMAAGLQELVARFRLEEGGTAAAEPAAPPRLGDGAARRDACARAPRRRPVGAL